MNKKIKVLTLGDMPLSPSGVAIQTKNVINSLLRTGKFQVISLGGAIKHREYRPVKTEEYGDDWIIYPVDNFGSPEIIRSIIRNDKPDILWFMTDPRFYEWLWLIEDEVRPLMPMVYYHVWDNFPNPYYNRPFYQSNDKIVTISKVTDKIVRKVTPDVECEYLPHAVNSDVYKPASEEDIEEIRKNNFPNWENDKFIFFWNNRNARRKMGASIIWWFQEFLEEVGKDKASLIMHTAPNDPNGPNLSSIVNNLGLNQGQVMFSTLKVSDEDMAALYNMADCVINVADAEGFGLSTLEALSCGTPIVVNMTGGLQEQVTDGEEWFGIGIEPASRAIIGSQQVPYIFEDRVSKNDFVDALKKIYYTPREELKEWGLKGRKHVEKNYNFKKYAERWPELMLEVHEKHGSWENRKNYVNWEIMEL